MNSEREKQNMLLQVNEAKRSNLINNREKTYKKKYLSEIIEEEKPKFTNNNLILAPVGSGKSYLIEKKLIPKDFNKNVIYLTSNTALKDSLAPNDNNVRKKLADKGESLGFYTSANKNTFGDVPYKVHVMTYYEFGERINNPVQTFTKDVGLIFCDEIHSLPRYIEYDNNASLNLAMFWLLSTHKDIQIFYFTATSEAIDILEKRKPGYFNNAKVFDYISHPEVNRYVAKSTSYIRHIGQSRTYLKDYKEGFLYKGYKALAFTRLITEQEKIEEIALEEGLKPLVLWSINNTERKMNEEQLKAREIVLSTGMIPEPYNILIINGAMQEGWNLYDDDITLAILDTTDITEQIQALGRVRKDVSLVIKKTKDENLVKLPMRLRNKYLNVELTAEDKDDLCNDLRIIDDRGTIRKWPTTKKHLIELGYEIEDKLATIDGKRTRVSIITKDN